MNQEHRCFRKMMKVATTPQAQEGMHTTSGTDIDWVVEHRGGFIVMENKTFPKDWKTYPVGTIF